MRGKSFLAELHKLGCRLHFENQCVEIYETVEQASPHDGAACAIPCSRHVRAMSELCLSMGFGSAAISFCEVAETGQKKIVFWNKCCICGRALQVCSLGVCGLSGTRVCVRVCVMTNLAS